MRKPIRMAVIGSGGMGPLTAGQYAAMDGLIIVAFCDIAPGRAEAAANAFNAKTGGAAKAFLSYEDMARLCAYDAAYIACPPDVQVGLACREMDRGIHVLCQVPAAVTLEDCRSLVSAVRRSGVVYQLAEQVRYLDFFDQWRGMAARGDFGKILYVEGQYLHYDPAWDMFINKETGESIRTADPRYLSDGHCEKSWRHRLFADPILYLPHTLSPLLSVTGGRISKVASFGTRPSGYVYEGSDVCDMQQAIMYNTEDVVFSVKAGFTTPHGQNNVFHAHWYQIKGTDAAVELPRGERDGGKLWTAGDGWSDAAWTTMPPDADDARRGATHMGADMEPVRTFLEAIRGDSAPSMDVYAAVETAAPAILAAESCRRGGEMLEVPDFR